MSDEQKLVRSAVFFYEKRSPPFLVMPFPWRTVAQHRVLWSVHFLFESFSRFEDRSVACGKGHSLTGCWVSAGSLITVLAGEGAESEEGDRFTCGEGIHDGVQNGIYDCSSDFLRHVVFSGDFLFEFGLISLWLAPLIWNCPIWKWIMSICKEQIWRGEREKTARRKVSNFLILEQWSR